MTAYAFKNKQDVLDLKRNLAFQRNRPDTVDQNDVGAGGVPSPSQTVFAVRASVSNESAVFFTGTGGIPPMAGSTPGSDKCNSVEWDSSTGMIVVNTNSEDDKDVYNVFSQPVGGNVFITAKFWNGIWLVDAEDCPSTVGPVVV